MIENNIPPEYRPYVPNVEIRLIPICDLVSNQEYQRKLSMIHVKKACENFDVNQINPVKVSRRNGVNYVFNGQHTAEIVAMKSGSRETPVWCMVFEDLEYTEEADIFANQMKNVKPLSPIEIFHAKCEAGDDKSLLIKSLVESYDMKIASSPLPGNIMAIGALESIYDKYGYEVLDRVLSLIIMTWEGDQKSFSANILNAVTRLVFAYRSDLKDEIFKEKLGIMSIKELTRLAKDRRVGSLGFTEVMYLTYCKKMKNPLDWDLIHATSCADRKRRREREKERAAAEAAKLEKENGSVTTEDGSASPDAIEDDSSSLPEVQIDDGSQFVDLQEEKDKKEGPVSADSLKEGEKGYESKKSKDSGKTKSVGNA